MREGGRGGVVPGVFVLVGEGGGVHQGDTMIAGRERAIEPTQELTFPGQGALGTGRARFPSQGRGGWCSVRAGARAVRFVWGGLGAGASSEGGRIPRGALS